MHLSSVAHVSALSRRGGRTPSSTTAAILLLLLSVFSISAAPAPASAAAGEQHFLQVAAAKLRQQPRHWSNAVELLSYGDAVTEVSLDADWYQVRSASGKEGFLPQSALTIKPIVLSGKTTAVPDEIDESGVILGGKGFSSQVEDSYKTTGKELNYEAVDALEAKSSSDEALLAFMTEGELLPRDKR